MALVLAVAVSSHAESARDQRYAFSLLDSNGKSVPSQAFSGKVLFVEVWATWCAPCIAGFPEIEKLHRLVKTNPHAALVTVHFGRDYGRYGTAAGFLRATGYTFPVLQDPDGVFTKKLNRLPFVVSIPKYAIFGPDGKILKRYSELDTATLADVRALFAAAAAKQ